MTIDEYVDEVKRTMAEKHPEYPSFDVALLLGLAGETGEVVDLLKKVMFHGHTLNVTTLGEELGDVLWYAVALCLAFGLDPTQVLEQNRAKLRRRYPTGFSSEASRNRPT